VSSRGCNIGKAGCFLRADTDTKPLEASAKGGNAAIPGTEHRERLLALGKQLAAEKAKRLELDKKLKAASTSTSAGSTDGNTSATADTSLELAALRKDISTLRGMQGADDLVKTKQARVQAILDAKLAAKPCADQLREIDKLLEAKAKTIMRQNDIIKEHEAKVQAAVSVVATMQAEAVQLKAQKEGTCFSLVQATVRRVMRRMTFNGKPSLQCSRSCISCHPP